MKNSRDTIISFIERLYSDNNNLMIRYEYNEIKGKHIVEILSKTGVLCEEFIWESKYDLSRMIKKEFGETLMFVSDNSLTKYLTQYLKWVITQRLKWVITHSR